jgi:hypothetical protein
VLGLEARAPFSWNRNGPNSVPSPRSPEQPGPPLVQKTTGSVDGLLEDSMYQ